MWRWVSLGGWAGPALVLEELGLLEHGKDALPFDNISSTFDGILQFIARGSLDGYFPALDGACFRPEAMGKNGLGFRARHTCFSHCDLNHDHVQQDLQRRCRSWQTLLSGSPAGAVAPVTFLRVAIAADPTEEVRLLSDFHGVVRERVGKRLPFRTVMVVMADGMAEGREDAERSARAAAPIVAQPLCALPHLVNPCIVWRVNRSATSTQKALSTPPSPPPPHLDLNEEGRLLAEYRDGLQSVITSMSKEMRWKQLEGSLPSLDSYLVSAPPLATPSELYQRNGTSLFTGTQRGIGSASGHNNNDGADGQTAKVGDVANTKRPWTGTECDDLLLAYGMHDGDEILAAESHARGSERSALESYEQLRKLLGSDEEEVEEAQGRAP